MRTSIILAVIAVLMLAFIVLFERDTLTSTELARREGRVLTSFVRKRVSEIEIARGDELVVLHREPDPESQDGSLGLWHVKEPMEAMADEDAVDILLGELEWMDARRRLESITAEDRKRFGLVTPKITVRYQVGATTGQLKVGALSPMTDGHYVQAQDPGTAYVVGKDLFEALDHAPAHYHTKELHDGLLLMTVLRLELVQGERKFEIEKRGDRFWLTRPVVGWASRPALEAIVDSLDALRAKRFIASKLTAAETKGFGFDTPRLSLAIGKKTMVEETEADGPMRFEERMVRFRLGAACRQHEGESFFIVGDEGPVMCVADDELAPVLEAIDGLREQRLLPLPDDAIDAVEITEGKAVLRVTKDQGDASIDKRWKYALQGGSGSHHKGVAEENTVSGWFAFLRAAEATAYDQGDAEGPLGKIAVQVEFQRGASKPPYTLVVYDEATRLLVRRGDERQLTAYPKDVFASLHASAAPFRNRRLLTLEGSAIASIRVAREQTVEVITRGSDGEYQVQAPVEVKADRVLVQEALRMLAGLEVLQFIADAPVREHGLSSPSLTVDFEARVEDESGLRNHHLVVGAETVGGHYGQLDDDPTVFIVPTTLVSKLRSPLASRTSIAVPIADIERITVTTAGKGQCTLVRKGGAFAFDRAEPSDAAADLAEAVATVRARDVAPYGQVLSVQDAETTVTIQSAGDTPEVRLLLGAETDEHLVPAARADVPLTFLMSHGDAKAISRCPQTQGK